MTATGSTLCEATWLVGLAFSLSASKISISGVPPPGGTMGLGLNMLCLMIMEEIRKEAAVAVRSARMKS